MNEVVISYSREDFEQMQTLRSALRRKVFPVLDDDDLLEVGELWRPSVVKWIKGCKAVVVMLSPNAKTSTQVANDLKFAQELNVPIFPVLIASDLASSTPADLVISEWIDLSSPEKYGSGIEVLMDKLFPLYGIDPKSPDQLVRNELYEIVYHLPNVKWIRIIQEDGLTYRYNAFTYNARHPHQSTATDREEDLFTPMSVATMSLSERISEHLNLGAPRFTVVAGQNGTHVLVPIGDGTKWLMGLGLQGKPSIDQVIQYFEDRDYLSNIIPVLGDY